MMIRLARRLATVDPIANAVSRPTPRFFAVAALATAAIAPAGALPLPTPPVALPAITAAVVLTAVDSNGQPLAHAVFEVYRADQPDGVQTPLLTVPGSGSVTVPLPPPSTIPDPEQQQPLSAKFPLGGGLKISHDEGLSEVYESGAGAGIATGPKDSSFSAGFGFDVYSQSTYSATHEVTIYSGGGCGPATNPTCFYWTVNSSAAADCPWQLSCGTDYYTATQAPSAVPQPEPQPCSKFAPHGGTC